MDGARGQRQAPRACPRRRDDRTPARGGALTRDPSGGQPPADHERLPFDVEVERLPAWAHVASALVLVLGGLVAVRIVPMLALLPALVLSSFGRRLSTSRRHVEVARDALEMGGREVKPEEILDVWREADGTSSDDRVIVAIDDGARGAEVAILYFDNPEQARRFAGAFAPRDSVVAGHRPRPADTLSSLRFVGIAAAFFGTGSWFGALALAYFAFGAFGVARARQIVARAEQFEVHTLFGSRSYAYADVDRVDVDAGVVTLKGGGEIAIARAAIRDTALAAPAWLEQARTRVLSRIAARARRA